MQSKFSSSSQKKWSHCKVAFTLCEGFETHSQSPFSLRQSRSCFSVKLSGSSRIAASISVRFSSGISSHSVAMAGLGSKGFFSNFSASLGCVAKYSFIAPSSASLTGTHQRASQQSESTRNFILGVKPFFISAQEPIRSPFLHFKFSLSTSSSAYFGLISIIFQYPAQYCLTQSPIFSIKISFHVLYGRSKPLPYGVAVFFVCL